jgi:ABC-type sulfate transport system permease subunit
MRDPGLAPERTTLARRRTTIPFLVVALLGARAALDAPVAGLLVAALAGAGAVAARRGTPTVLTALVLTLAVAALGVPSPPA